jgi:IclR family acetate operon transcriptional repressor
MSREGGMGKAAGEEIVFPDSVVSVERALRIVELLTEEEDGLTLTEVALALQVNKAIASKLLQTLEKCDYIFRHGGNFQLTHKINNLSVRQLGQQRLLEQTTAVLKPLAKSIGELVRMAVVEGDRIGWVLGFQGQRHIFRLGLALDSHINLHALATGRAWMSTLPFDRALELMRRDGLMRFTKHTIVDPEELRRIHAEEAAKGYSVTYEEIELGVGGVAAPIIVEMPGRPPQCVGAASIAAPSVRVDRTALEAAAPLIVAATQRLGRLWPLHDDATGILRHRDPAA